MPRGLFFENFVHYVGIFPPLSSCIRKNQAEIGKLAELLYNENVSIFWDGTGRSGKVASRGERNFGEGLGRESDYAGSGFDPGSEKDDVYIAISGSGREDLTERAEKAKNHGMKLATMTRNPESNLAKKSDVVITLPQYITGEVDIKNYFGNLFSSISGNEKTENNAVPNSKKKNSMPFQELGAVFELSALELIDGFSYAFNSYTTKSDFPFHMIEKKLYNSLIYTGALGCELEKQKSKLDCIIDTIIGSKGNVYTTGVLYSAEIADIAAIRINHEIYERHKRKAMVIDSRKFPKIKEGDILIPISGEDDPSRSLFTNIVAKKFSDMKNKVFPFTFNPESELVKYADEENSIIFPKGKEYELKEKYAIRDFDIGVVRVLDSIALSIGRSEAEMQKSHSIFS